MMIAALFAPLADLPQLDGRGFSLL